MDTLIKLIKSHGINAWCADGQLWADNIYTLDGTVHTAPIQLERTVAAVRVWLGY